MYSTIKELHVEIEQRISQITSNRHRSIPKEYIDMVLNRCAIKYIQEIVNKKTNYKREGLEDTNKRVDDLKSLKRETGFIKVSKDSDDKGYILFPSDYLNIISSDSYVEYSKFDLEEKSKTQIVNKKGFIIDFSKFNYSTSNTWTKAVLEIDDIEIDITNTIQFLKTYDYDADLFEFINSIIDILHDFKYDVYWELFDNNYVNKGMFIFDKNKNISSVNITFTSQSGSSTHNIKIDELTVSTNNILIKGSKHRGNDLIPSEDISLLKNNYYLNKNRHRNPITEAINNRLYVHFGDNFIITDINITYIKKPKLFNIALNQMSDITITNTFMDYVVAELLLELKDNSYNIVKQQSNI